MPALANTRHERFAQELAKGYSESDAYQRAGFKPNRGNAARLNANENVQKRVQELQDVGAQRAEVTVEEHLNKLQQLRDAAWQSGQLSPAIQAEQLRGKVAGHYVERKEIEATHHTVTDEPMTAEEWESQYAQTH